MSFKYKAMHEIIEYLNTADSSTLILITEASKEYQDIMERSRYVPKEYQEPVTNLGKPVSYKTVYCAEGTNGFIKKFESLEEASLYIYSKSKKHPIIFNRLVKHLKQVSDNQV